MEKLKESIRDKIKTLKTLDKDINKFETHWKNMDYLTASILLQKMKPTIIKYSPDFEKEFNTIESEINKQARQYKMSFDGDFTSSCEKNNLFPVGGDSRKGFRIKGIIEVKINFEKQFATISTTSKKFKVDSLNIEKMIVEVNRIHERLFNREWNPDQFLRDLYEAYLSESNNKIDKEVLLEAVYAQLWLKVQMRHDSFRKSFDKDKVKDYPIDEFSVDLSKILIGKPDDLFLSEGANGITVFDNNGNFRTFKFLTFKRAEGR